ncbi:MAG: hypothetical protein HY255_03810 [Betaproteobacteria bacterium]|nr:hypothetical protein [Betaproteobacteria bacterium]
MSDFERPASRWRNFLAGFTGGFGLTRFERLALFLLLAGTFFLYQPGLYGDFMFDDMANITYNKKLIIENGGWQQWYEASVSSFSGLFKRPISMLSFAVNASTTGMNAPLYFKLTNLFIHLTNGVLVFWLSRLLLRRVLPTGAAAESARTLTWASLLAAGLWLVHPLNLSSVLYIVQRMTSLSALFTFLALILYALGRNRIITSQRHGWTWLLAGLFGAGLLALLSKENGVLIPLLMLVVEACLYRFDAAHTVDTRRLKWLFLVTVALPAVVFVLATMVQYPKLYVGYELRDFNMAERVMTEARAIWFYLRLALLPSLSAMALYHDDFAVSRSLFEPWTTLPALLALAGLLAAGAWALRKAPMLAFGIFWFLAGHALESTTLPLELIHEHRNYLPLFGPILALSYYAAQSGWSPDTLRVRRIGIVVLLALAAGLTYLRADYWGNFLLFSVTESNNHPGSERAAQQLGRTYMILLDQDPNPDFAQGAEQAFRRAIANDATGTIPLISLLQLQMRMKQPPEQALIDELVQRLATKRPPPSMMVGMRTLIDCQMFAYCTLSDAEIDRIFAAPIGNPKVIASNKSLLKLFLAQYEVDKRADLAKGVKLIEEGLQISPDSVDLHLNMARVSRIGHAFDLSARHLADARRLNSFGYLTTEIEEEAQKLERDRRAAENPAARPATR